MEEERLLELTARYGTLRCERKDLMWVVGDEVAPIPLTLSPYIEEATITKDDAGWLFTVKSGFDELVLEIRGRFSDIQDGLFYAGRLLTAWTEECHFQRRIVEEYKPHVITLLTAILAGNPLPEDAVAALAAAPSLQGTAMLIEYWRNVEEEERETSW